MKMKASAIVKIFCIPGLSVLMSSPVFAQKEKEKPLITQDETNKINAIVKPLKDQFDKQLSQDKTYLAYKADVKKVSEAKSMQEKKLLTADIEKNYKSFFQNLWSAAKVDEKSYQDRIRGVFPNDIARLIHFDIFLTFWIDVTSFTTEQPAPPPPDQCLDICTMASGEIDANATLIAGGTGSYGNCYLKTNSWSAAAGWNTSDAFLKNNITIPGTLPDDDRKLRVTKSYELKEEATAFAVAGFGVAEAILTTYQSNEDLNVMAPVIWASHSLITKTINENYLLQKSDVAKSFFHTYGGVFSEVVSGSWSLVECTSIKWKICEEK